jgi:hypothetical protein
MARRGIPINIEKIKVTENRRGLESVYQKVRSRFIIFSVKRITKL